MILSVFNPILYSMSLEESLKYLKSLGVDAMELGCGGYPGTTHADVSEFVKSDKKIAELKNLFEKYEMKISALSVHGNGVHPVKKVADKATFELESACAVANKLGVDRVVTFSGCPGDGKSDTPNWVATCWPPEYIKLLEWQWNEVLIPYWAAQNKIAKDAKVKIALEMHPGFMVYNTETMMRLRKAAGEFIGANFDPSHLLWQGIDPAEAIRQMGEAIFFFHAKDTMFNYSKKNFKGVLDTSSFTSEAERSWIFRTVGCGHCNFKEMITSLRMIGYDYALSIEHEDSLMTPKEGLEKAVKNLKDVMIYDGGKNNVFWA